MTVVVDGVTKGLGGDYRALSFRPRELPDLEQWIRVLSDFNASTLDRVGPLGGDRGMKVLQDMNELEVDHEDFVKILAPGVEWV
jgi:hypothetical protein